MHGVGKGVQHDLGTAGACVCHKAGREFHVPQAALHAGLEGAQGLARQCRVPLHPCHPCQTCHTSLTHHRPRSRCSHAHRAAFSALLAHASAVLTPAPQVLTGEERIESALPPLIEHEPFARDVLGLEEQAVV